MSAANYTPLMQSIGTWGLREEARESWEHFVCDKCVYFAKPSNVNVEGSHVFAEKYVRNDLWFHIRWTKLETGQAGDHHNEAIVEAVPFNKSSNAVRKLDSPIAAVDGDSPVFVEVPKLVELPEMMSVYGIRSVIRLKGIKSTVDAGIEQSEFLPISLIGPTNRECDPRGDFLIRRDGTGKQMYQVPSQLIKRSAETVNEIPYSECDLLVRRRLWCDYEEVLGSIRIVCLGDCVRVAFDPILKSLLSSLEVKVSPSGFHVYVLN